MPLSSKVTVIVGGATRQGSVLKALECLSATDLELQNKLILIHDGARCFITRDVIEKAILAAETFDAVTVAVPVIDSIKKVAKDGTVLESLDRSMLWSVQTPQIFRGELLIKAHQTENNSATDDASLVEKFHHVHVVEGSRDNFKITTPFDLQVANLMASNKVSQ